MTIDRELLLDMGFVVGTGYPHETWVYEGMFWVTFGPVPRDDRSSVSADIARPAFFKAFLTAVAYEAAAAERDNHPR